MVRQFEDTRNGAMRAIAARRPNVFGAFLGLAHEVMHSDAGLSKLDRELVGAHVSHMFGCDFCQLGHLDTAEVFGGPEVRSALEAPDARLAPLLALADRVVANTVDQSAVDAVLAAGHSEQALEDVIFVAGLFGFANRMVTGFGIEYDATRDREGSQRLAQGYLWK